MAFFFYSRAHPLNMKAALPSLPLSTMSSPWSLDQANYPVECPHWRWWQKMWRWWNEESMTNRSLGRSVPATLRWSALGPQFSAQRSMKLPNHKSALGSMRTPMQGGHLWTTKACPGVLQWWTELQKVRHWGAFPIIPRIWPALSRNRPWVDILHPSFLLSQLLVWTRSGIQHTAGRNYCWPVKGGTGRFLLTKCLPS